MARKGENIYKRKDGRYEGDISSPMICRENHIKQTTKMMYYSHLKNHIESNIGGIQLKKLNTDMLQKFVDSESKQYSPKNVHAVFFEA